MKPFDLESAKRGEPLITRNGQKLVFLAHDRDNVQAWRRLILRVEGNPLVIFLHEDGRVSHNGKSELDAFMAPRMRTVWVNLYPDAICFHYSTEIDANAGARSHRIGGKAWPLEIEE